MDHPKINPSELPNPESIIPLPVHKGGNQPEYKFVQGKPNCCPFKDYKCPHTGKDKEIVFICDIPIAERHKYIDAEQDINHPSMKVIGHAKNELPNPLDELKKLVKRQQAVIDALLSKYPV